MLGNAMLTMNRSSDDKKTPVSTIREVATGRARLPDTDPTGGVLVSTVIKLTLTWKVL